MNKPTSEKVPFYSTLDINERQISVGIYKPRPNEKHRLLLSFDDLLLPPTTFTQQVTSISARADLVSAITEATEEFANKRIHGRQTHMTLVATIKNWAKFIEYLWLNGCYRLTDCRPDLTDQLAKMLARGGWSNALRLSERANHLVNGVSKQEASTWLNGPKGRNPILSSKVSVLLGTNASGPERMEVLDIVLKKVGLTNLARSADLRNIPSSLVGMSSSSLVKVFADINCLVDVNSDYGLRFTPYSETMQLASSLGRPKGRTGTLTPAHIGKWLKVSFRVIDQESDAIIRALEILHERIKVADPVNNHVTKRTLSYFLKVAVSDLNRSGRIAKHVEPISSRHYGAHEEVIGLGQLIRNLMTACFVIISILNGRRKGEVSDPSVGLSSRSLEVIDEQLGVYQCSFFIEKTIRDHVNFYVGDATFRAVQILEKISSLARKIHGLFELDQSKINELAANGSLFLIPPIPMMNKPQKIRWYNFKTLNKGDAAFLASMAGDVEAIWTRPHMFRRAYALLYFYRYEFGDLISLSQQLGHFGVQMTKVYVTWLDGRSPGASIEAFGKPADRGSQEFEEIRRELEVVGSEKIRETVQQIIQDSRKLSGGFVRLIQRFHQRFGRNIEYRLRSFEAQSKVIADFLVERGHSSIPFPHGNCLASSTRLNSGAGCFSKVDGSIKRQDAGPSTCGNCPYHCLGSPHIKLMIDEAQALQKEIAVATSDSILLRRKRLSLENLERWIALHSKRIVVENYS